MRAGYRYCKKALFVAETKFRLHHNLTVIRNQPFRKKPITRLIICPPSNLPQPLASLPHPPGHHRQTSKTSRFVAIICFDQHVCSDPEVVSGHFRPCVSRRRCLIARNPDPHVICEGCPSRQPVAKVFVSVIVHFAFVSPFFTRCLSRTMRALYAECATLLPTLTDLLAESRGACVCACIVCCVTPPRNKTS